MRSPLRGAHKGRESLPQRGPLAYIAAKGAAFLSERIGACAPTPFGLLCPPEGAKGLFI